MQSVSVNNINIYPFSSRNELIDYVEKEKKSLIAINAEKILHVTEQTRELINKNIGYADGIGAVWALKKKGFKNNHQNSRMRIMARYCKPFLPVEKFLPGGCQRRGQSSKPLKKLKKEFPGINLLGYRNGYIKIEEEQQQLIQTIATLKPDIVFVAMGSPKQELLMQKMQQHHTAIYQGLGGSFDVYMGNVERAPEWWVKNNLEWAYRWIRQPKARTKRNLQLFRFFL